MSAGSYVLAYPGPAPDREFPTLAGLARALVAERDRRLGGAELVLICADLGRPVLPHGVCVALRLRDVAHPGRGEFLGYAFVPSRHEGGAAAPLMAAIRDLSQARAA